MYSRKRAKGIVKRLAKGHLSLSLQLLKVLFFFFFQVSVISDSLQREHEPTHQQTAFPSKQTTKIKNKKAQSKAPTCVEDIVRRETVTITTTILTLPPLAAKVRKVVLPNG